jgi:aspartyl protease family protein
MGESDAPRLIVAVAFLVLAASALVAYRLPIGKLLRMILAWVGIFAFAFLILSFRPEMKMVWERLTGELTGAPRQVSSDKEIRLTRMDNGHFWVRAKVNGQDVNFMVDSGASTTAINAKTAESVGIDWAGSNDIAELSTANGNVTAKQVKLSSISVDGFTIKDHTAVVAEEFGETNVVGMNFLDAFESWNVSGDIMTLKH